MCLNDELELSKEFRFDIIKDDLVALTKRNVAITEAMIVNDSAYYKSINKNAKPTFKVNIKTGYKEVVYGGSTAYWVSELKKVLLEGKVVSDDEYKNMLFYVVNAIDRENKTHLNSDNVGRIEITDRIYNLSKHELVECLKDINKGFKLIELISEKTNPLDKNKKARINYSFATKFCHFMCYYLFEDDLKDNYSIYDSVVNRAIKKYITYYKINDKGKSLLNYKDFIGIIDEVRECAYKENGVMISRNGFDHLLWFYYKGR